MLVVSLFVDFKKHLLATCTRQPSHSYRLSYSLHPPGCGVHGVSKDGELGQLGANEALQVRDMYGTQHGDHLCPGQHGDRFGPGGNTLSQ